MKKEAIQVQLAWGSLEAVNRYWDAGGAAALVVAKAKTWEEVREPAKTDFLVGLEEILANHQTNRKGKQSLVQAVFSRGGELLGILSRSRKCTLRNFEPKQHILCDRGQTECPV